MGVQTWAMQAPSWQRAPVAQGLSANPLPSALQTWSTPLAGAQRVSSGLQASTVQASLAESQPSGHGVSLTQCAPPLPERQTSRPELAQRLSPSVQAAARQAPLRQPSGQLCTSVARRPVASHTSRSLWSQKRWPATQTAAAPGTAQWPATQERPVAHSASAAQSSETPLPPRPGALVQPDKSNTAESAASHAELAVQRVRRAWAGIGDDLT